jgi:hypothetical protein
MEHNLCVFFIVLVILNCMPTSEMIWPDLTYRGADKDRSVPRKLALCVSV